MITASYTSYAHLFGEVVQIACIVGVAGEHRLTVVAALDDVVRVSRDQDSSRARHFGTSFLTANDQKRTENSV